uniref:Avr9/Cf-9 rapidly elicited protein 141 n=2 Tax=Solanum tuberosum TaxID=4113 RepID=M1A1F0_SOLTU
MEGEFMNNIIQKWFGNETDCPKQDGMAIASSLTLDSFMGLFLIAGVSAGSALLLFFLIFLYQNREILATDDSVWQKLSAIANAFDKERDNSNSMSEEPSEGNEIQTATLFAESEASTEILPHLPLQSPEIRISDGLGASPALEGFSTTEPGTPVHENITGIT